MKIPYKEPVKQQDYTDGRGYHYIIYKADHAINAQKKLKEIIVDRPLTYAIIETPEGNWAKDINGPYIEGNSSAIPNTSGPHSGKTGELASWDLLRFPKSIKTEMDSGKMSVRIYLAATCGVCGSEFWTFALKSTKEIPCLACGAKNKLSAEQLDELKKISYQDVLNAIS